MKGPRCTLSVSISTGPPTAPRAVLRRSHVMVFAWRTVAASEQSSARAATLRHRSPYQRSSVAGRERPSGTYATGGSYYERASLKPPRPITFVSS